MRKRNLSAALVVLTMLLIGVNAAVKRAASHSVPRQLVHKIEAGPLPVTVLAMGNSLMAAGFDEAVVTANLARGDPRFIALNAALGATGVIEHLALTRLALRHHHVATLVYGYFDQQMASDLPSSNADLIGNHSLLYYQEPALTDRYAHFDLLNRIAFRTYRSCALLRDRGAIWERVEKLRRRMQGVGMPREETSRFGRRADFSLLEAQTSRDFDRRCRTVIDSRAFLAPPTLALFAQAAQQGARILVVTMPMHPSHLSRFYSRPLWPPFQDGTREAVVRTGAAFLDASGWLPDETLFADHLHLAPAGAAVFSRRLAEYLTANQLD